MKKILIIILILSLNTVFGVTLDLNDCIGIAEKNNIDVKISDKDRELSKYSLKDARFGFYDLTGSGSYTLTGDDDDNLNSNTSASIGITGNISPYLFHNYIYSGVSVESSEINHTEVLNTLRYRIINSFFQVLIAEEKLKLQKDIAEYSQKKYEEAEVKFSMGNISRSDLLNFEVSRSSDIIDLKSAESSLKRNKQNLVYYMNHKIIPDSLKLKYEEQTDGEDIASEKALITEALDNRPDIQVQKNYLKQQDLGLSMNYDNFLPSLNGSLTYGYTRTEDLKFDKPLYPGHVGTTTTDGITGRLSLSVNLNYSDLNGIDRGKVEVKRSTLQLDNKIESVKNEVRIQLLDLENQKNNLELAGKHVELAKENLDLADKLFFIGDKSATDYLQARNNYINARYQKINSHYNYILSKYELYNSVGRTP